VKLPGRLAFVIASLAAWPAWAVERFPPPDFTDHGLPSPGHPNPPHAIWSWLDVGLLATFLVLASMIAVRWRSRKAMVGLSIAALAYFGFYREGCVCPIGAIQNVSLALADPSYTIPLTVLAFFLLPLVFTLMAGRGFCAGVCPLGAIQDVVLVKPVRVPGWLEQGLGLVPYVYLAGAVLLAATGSAFIICQFDPFVGFFRLSGEVGMLIFGGVLLVIGMFVGRPYCRFLCPYGVILRHLSRFSAYHLTISPTQCIQCRLCEPTCPFGAIDTPVATIDAPTPSARRRMLAMVLAGPVIVAGSAWLGWMLGPRLAAEGTEAIALHTFAIGGAIAGGLIGLVIAGRLIRLTMQRPRSDYNANSAACYSCVRCVEACPQERSAALPTPGLPAVSRPAPVALTKTGAPT
jgi:ferredoxin